MVDGGITGGRRRRPVRTAVVVLVAFVVLALILLPVVQRPTRGYDTGRGNRLKQLVIGAAAYASDTGVWPSTLEDMVRTIDLPERYLTRRDLGRQPRPHEVYVRPVPRPADRTPVIVDQPDHRGHLWVAYADGSIHFFRDADARRLWAEAGRLAALPRAQTEGIASADWAAVGDLLDR